MLKKFFEKTKSNFDNIIKTFTGFNDEFYEELEESLLLSDVGVKASGEIIANLKERAKTEKVKDQEELKQLLIKIISVMLEVEADEDLYNEEAPTIVLIMGVNGVGKTTSIGKLINMYKDKKILVAAADTFRAAAVEQLEIWCERSSVPIIKNEDSQDPGSVVFDAIKSANAKGTEILFVDTAGRLQNKKNLMEELKKINRIIEKNMPNAKKHVYLVLDATTGQNGLQQAKVFNEAAEISGIILTKFDGTSKGGVVLAIKSELNIPIKFIGVGEGINDLELFNPQEFAENIFA